MLPIRWCGLLTLCFQGPCPHGVEKQKNQCFRVTPLVFFINFKLGMKDLSTLKLLPVTIKQRLIFNHCAHMEKQNAVAKMERSRWKEKK